MFTQSCNLSGGPVEPAHSRSPARAHLSPHKYMANLVRPFGNSRDIFLVMYIRLAKARSSVQRQHACPCILVRAHAERSRYITNECYFYERKMRHRSIREFSLFYSCMPDQRRPSRAYSAAQTRKSPRCSLAGTRSAMDSLLMWIYQI